MRSSSRYSALIAATCLAGPACAVEIDGFIEPYRMIDLASTDVATIASISVKPGDLVTPQQTIIELDTRVLRASLNTANQRRHTLGRIRSAQAMVRLKRSHLDKLRPLLSSGHAQAAEIAKAEADLEVAEANLLIAREERETAELDYERISLEVARRTLKSPIAATVVAVHKLLGEAVIPSDPILVTIAELNRLKLALQIPTEELHHFAQGQQITANCSGEVTMVPTTVDYIAPITDPESGTVLVELLIANQDAAFRAGSHCKIEF